MQAALEEDVHVALPGEADPPVQLHRAVGDEAPRVRGGALRHARGLLGVGVAGVDAARRMEEQRAGAIDLHHGVHQGVLHGLEEADRPVELGARAGVLDRRLELPLARAAEVRGGRDEQRGPGAGERGKRVAGRHGIGGEVDAVEVHRRLIARQVVDVIGLDPQARRIHRQEAEHERLASARADQQRLRLHRVLHEAGAAGEDESVALGPGQGVADTGLELARRPRDREARGAPVGDGGECAGGHVALELTQHEAGADRRRQRRRQGMAPDLLEEPGDPGQREAGAAGRLGDGEPGPAELDDLLPHSGVPGGELPVVVDGLGCCGDQVAQSLDRELLVQEALRQLLQQRLVFAEAEVGRQARSIG